MKEIKNVFSAFDGMSCGQIALNKLGVVYENYYASEINKSSIKLTQSNYSDTIQIGDIRNVTNLPKIDLMMGGSSCQNFSFAGKREGMSTNNNIEITSLEQYLDLKEKGFKFVGYSYLFWEYVRILREAKPKYFLLENVMMQEKWETVISEALGVEPITINSTLVSAQNRKRLYWTNIEGIEQPEDKNIKLRDILDNEEYINKASILGRRINKSGHREDYNKDIPIIQCLEVRKANREKSGCLTTVQKDNVLTNLPIGRHIDAYGKHTGERLDFRNYTLNETARLQTVDPLYFYNDEKMIVSQNQAIKMLGNGWTVDVIAHILGFMK